TSKGIQKRYAKICTDAKRKDWEIPEKFDLLHSKHSFTPEEIKKTPEEIPQSKEENSKEEKSKVKNSAKAHERVHSPGDQELFKNFQEWITKYAPRVNQLKEPLTIDEYLKIREKFSKEVISKVLKAMQN